ncbi:hypothetical protein BX666DRAFT_1857129 [Dichotomocladium elegans]|nr:hypothetical protein BX666DRAFT_1857129 [Dichotomocladium elegans]
MDQLVCSAAAAAAAAVETVTAHKAIQLPEIVSLIIRHLFDPPQIPATSQHSKSNIHGVSRKRTYQWIYPCLFVSQLWHDCAARVMYSTIVFEESPAEYDAFLKFAAVIGAESHIAYSNGMDKQGHSSPFASLAIGYPIVGPSNVFVDPLLMRTTLAVAQYERIEVYRRSIRSLSIRKCKEPSMLEPLDKISRHCSRIESLELYVCDPVTDDAVLGFLKGGGLRRVVLAGCYRVTDALILAVAATSPRLEHLDLRACGNISDASIAAIATRCPRLAHLNVGRIRDRQKITSASIVSVAEHTSVTVLGLAGCDIDDTAMIRLAEHRHRHLERISVNNCHRLTNRSIRAHVRLCTNLSVFEMKECDLIDDWESVAELVQRKVLLTLCDRQNKACLNWAHNHGKVLEVKAPLK